jgi:acetyl esterase/lipase
MSKKRIFLADEWLIVGMMLFGLPAASQVAPPDQAVSGYSVTAAVPYSQTKGTPLVADLYIPAGEGPFPAVVFIHGGGWRSGDRTQLRKQAAFLAQRGIFGMAIEYRLAPANPFPAALDDSKQAVAWLREHAAEYHIKSSAIAAVGSSAGGNLAALLGTESTVGSKNEWHVEAVVILNGIFDLSTMPSGTMVPDFLGGSCSEKPQLCRDASPLTHVKNKLPPFLVMHGNADLTAPYSQATTFRDKMEVAHNHVEFYTAEGGLHTFWAKPEWTELSLEKLAKFLQQSLTQ